MELTEESSPASTVTNPTQAEEPTIGNYKVLKKIGKGKSAKVMLAKHELTGEKVAIKIFDKTQPKPGLLQRLYREAEIMKMLDHPNIVKLYQVIETTTTFYLIMEYASGGDMYKYLALHGRMKDSDARAKFRQIVSAVQYCHERGIIHRDLKAGNVLLDGETNIKIADFGLSQEFSPGNQLEVFCGTRKYAAPEIFLHRKHDGPKVDVWSLGILLYKMVSNTFPFDHSTDIGKQVVLGEYQIPCCMTQGCVNLLKKLLVPDPTERAGLDTVMKDKWINQGFKNEELKPYIKLEEGLTDSK